MVVHDFFMIWGVALLLGRPMDGWTSFCKHNTSPFSLNFIKGHLQTLMLCILNVAKTKAWMRQRINFGAMYSSDVDGWSHTIGRPHKTWLNGNCTEKNTYIIIYLMSTLDSDLACWWRTSGFSQIMSSFATNKFFSWPTAWFPVSFRNHEAAMQERIASGANFKWDPKSPCLFQD